MMNILDRLHVRLGDFWWYSLMLFCACRAADLLNAFVGLWLVPKYVDPSELGAVMPLTNFANFLALPAAAFANTFRNEVSRLSINHEFGKLKTLMRGVFIATAIFLFLAIIASRFLLPMFLDRIRIVEGSLGWLIIVASFVTVALPIYSNTLQALKKFREQSLINIIGAPIRLIVMAVAIPFRPIAGYFSGAIATPVFNIIASFFSLKEEFAVTAEPYWNKKTVKKFSSLFIVFTIGGIASSLYLLVSTTILRQRLPDLDSAGYYMATRFSDIASFLLAVFITTLFPYAAELAAQKKDIRPIILKTAFVTISFYALVALPFFFVGEELLSLLPHGEQYRAYWWAIPWLIGVGGLEAFISLFTLAEISANRFTYLKWMVPFELFISIILLLVTGYGYFSNNLPTVVVDFLTEHNIRSLDTMLLWMTLAAMCKAVFCGIHMAFQKRPTLSLPLKNKET